METKIEMYNELVNDIKVYLAGNNKYFADVAQLQEYNIWSYWQGGRNALNAKILLVGQDWGEITSQQSKDFFAALNTAKDTHKYYMKSVINGNSPTDKTLIQCFEKIGYKIVDNVYDDLFFINMGLEYRVGKTSGHTGGYSDKWISNGQAYLRRLINIIEPEYVICLGRKVFDNVVKAYGYPYYNVIIDLATNGKFVVKNSNGKEVVIIPAAHPGSFGKNNRIKNRTHIKGEAAVIEDWVNMAKQYPGLKNKK